MGQVNEEKIHWQPLNATTAFFDPVSPQDAEHSGD